MSRSWSEKQSGALMGKWFSYKSMGYTLLLVNAEKDGNRITMEYFLEKEGDIQSVKVKVPYNVVIPSVTGVFPQGAQMEQEIPLRFPIRFGMKEDEKMPSLDGMIEWGPFHPLLPEPVQFHIQMQDEVILKTWIDTGYNYRGIEGLCAGKKPADVLEMIERTSAVNGFPMGLAFTHAVEQINGIDVPEKAMWLRLMLMEMSSLSACLQSLNHIAQCLGLPAAGVRFFKLIALYHEAAELFGENPQLTGILEFGGLNRDISRDIIFGVNAVLQEMEGELKAIRAQWENSRSIKKRLKAAGKVEEAKAAMMTGRLTRAAGYPEDVRKYSGLPYARLSWNIPTSSGSNCYSRTMLIFDDALLSLNLIDESVQNMPRGEIKTRCKPYGSGEALIREPDAYGTMAVLVKQQGGMIESIKIRNASSMNFSFLQSSIEGTEITDLPLVLSSFEIDFSGLEK